jgi:hypothetical protein
MKKILFLAGLFLTIMALSSCDPENVIEDETNLTTETEDASDYVWDSQNINNIVLNGTSISTSSSSVTVSGTTATITAPGNYTVSGSLNDGKIIVNTSDDGVVRIILNDVTINNSSSSPLYIEAAQKTVIILPDNTSSTLSDGSTYSSSLSDACIYSNTYLSFYGNGSLTVNGNYGDGISSQDRVIIKSGSINVSAVDEGIIGVNNVVIHDGTITVSSGSDGIKSTNDNYYTTGYVLAEAGIFQITSGGDAIYGAINVTLSGGSYTIVAGGGNTSSAGTTSCKGIKAVNTLTIGSATLSINSADDCIHSDNAIVINGAIITAQTNSSAGDGIHADNSITINSGTITVSKSYEAVEGLNITMNGGSLYITAVNDGINGTEGTVSGGTESVDASILRIAGGQIIVVGVTNGDGVDCNGNVYMTGGTLVVHGLASTPEEAIDVNGDFEISGGLLISSGKTTGGGGGGGGTPLSSSSSQKSIYVTFSSAVSASTIFHVQDASGNSLVTFKPSGQYKTMTFSSSSLVSGTTFSIYTGGTCSGTVDNGYYTGGSYSGGTFRKTFTCSSTITTITI